MRGPSRGLSHGAASGSGGSSSDLGWQRRGARGASGVPAAWGPAPTWRARRPRDPAGPTVPATGAYLRSSRRGPRCRLRARRAPGFPPARFRAGWDSGATPSGPRPVGTRSPLPPGVPPDPACPLLACTLETRRPTPSAGLRAQLSPASCQPASVWAVQPPPGGDSGARHETRRFRSRAAQGPRRLMAAPLPEARALRVCVPPLPAPRTPALRAMPHALRQRASPSAARSAFACISQGRKEAFLPKAT